MAPFVVLLGLAALSVPGEKAGVSDKPSFPTGWVAVTRKDVENTSDFQLRRRSATGFLRARGDFDGDGKPDLAVLAKSAIGDRAGVVFRLSSRAEPVIHALSSPVPVTVASLGVDRVAPGAYKTACAKGYGTRESCVETFTSRQDGVALFQFEASSSYLFWLDERLVEIDITD